MADERPAASPDSVTQSDGWPYRRWHPRRRSLFGGAALVTTVALDHWRRRGQNRD